MIGNGCFLRQRQPGCAKRIAVLASFAILAVTTLVQTSGAQVAPTPANRLNALRAATSLYQGDLKPWYVKIDMDLYDTIGKPSGKASVEEWWGGEKLDKRLYTTAKGTSTYLRKDGKTYRSEGYEYPGYFLDKLSSQIVGPIPPVQPTDEALSNKEGFGKISLDCLEVEPPTGQAPLQSRPVSNPRLPTRYCVSPDDSVLRAVLGSDNVNFLHNSWGKFQNRQVAVEVSAKAGNIVRATAHVTALNSKPLPPDVFSSDGLVEQTSQPISIAFSVIKGKIVSKVQPKYPLLAMQQRVRGTVVIHAFIGKDGHIHSPEVIYTPSSLLDEETLSAVRQWVYQPYLLNGTPVEVETTIEVVFSFG